MATKKLKNRNVPNLRFPGFEGEWEERKLGEIAEFSKGKGISKSEIAENGITECIRYGELYTHYGEVIDEIKSRTNIDAQDLVFSKANDVIIPSSGETQLDIATASCVIKAGIALGGDLNIIRAACNGIFLSYYLNSKKKMDIARLAQGISVVHLYSSELAVLSIRFPTLNEQNKIASFLALIDRRIATQNKIIEDFRSLKQTVTKKLFSRRLKFKYPKGQYFPDWRETKFGELTEVVSSRNKNNEKLPVYSINNKSGFVPQNEQFDGIDSDERGYDIKMYKLIGKNTFAYNPARINVGSVGYSGELENIIISSLYVCFKTKESIRDQFLFQYLKTNFFGKEVAKNVEGGVRDYLFYDNFAKIKFYVPCIQEQDKIANVLSELDQKIAMQVSILQNLEEQKKYFLQKLFI
ncbi:restriction endonuclease subunit S [Sediminibacterium ginsengisoli]|uniref:Type I restriction enzyme, S subunit n=1 Tax=Sediminibacterium ginsengisoli TaxID=413434 RepID=A0A1T4RK48_9BACT|nr:restriction endonuclease subunit S [Sediminibacterium ginsengisoli]SKA16277.1 type I restriction enzyme, S subunit [Sediminibacterium ginsengisoli]